MTISTARRASYAFALINVAGHTIHTETWWQPFDCASLSVRAVFLRNGRQT